MINLAVFNARDLIKYLVGIILLIAIGITSTRYFSYLKQKNISTHINLKDTTFISCLEETIPGIEEQNKMETDINKPNSDPLKMVLSVELGMMDAVSKNEEKETEESFQNDEQETQPQEEKQLEKAQTGLKTEVIENNVPNKYTNTYQSVQVKNGTKYQLTEEMLNPDITVNNQNILIYHTHTCESYTPSELYPYTQTGNYRTTDLNFSVARVGTELQNHLIGYGYQVIHDKTYHDYPSYTGSYGRSLTTAMNALKQAPNTDVIIDLHRDAIGDPSYAPTVKIGEEYAAQLMFVIGTDEGGASHPNWNQNLKFAIKVQQKANQLYPGLFKPILLGTTRYNQHIGKAASIIEVGATGNTLEQCLNSMKYLSKVLSEVMK